MTELPAWSDAPAPEAEYVLIPVPPEEAALMPQPPAAPEEGLL